MTEIPGSAVFFSHFETTLFVLISFGGVLRPGETDTATHHTKVKSSEVEKTNQRSSWPGSWVP